MTCLSEQKYRGYTSKMFPLLEVVQACHPLLSPTPLIIPKKNPLCASG